jgi:hypothetical protein
MALVSFDHQGTKGTKERQVQGPVRSAQPFGPGMCSFKGMS